MQVMNPTFALQPILANAERQVPKCTRGDPMLLSDIEGSSLPNLYGFKPGRYGTDFYKCVDMKEMASTIPASMIHLLLGESGVSKVIAEKKGGFIGPEGGLDLGAQCILGSRNGPPALLRDTNLNPFDMFVASSLRPHSEIEIMCRSGKVAVNESETRRVAPVIFMNRPLSNSNGFMLVDVHESVDPQKVSPREQMTSGTAGVAFLVFLNVAFRTTYYRGKIRQEHSEKIQFARTALYRQFMDKWPLMSSSALRDEVMKEVSLSSSAFGGQKMVVTISGVSHPVTYCLPKSLLKKTIRRLSESKFQQVLSVLGRSVTDVMRNVPHCKHCGLVLHSMNGIAYYRNTIQVYDNNQAVRLHLNRIECSIDHSHEFVSGVIIPGWGLKSIISRSLALDDE
jgi:hypothetical protein